MACVQRLLRLSVEGYEVRGESNIYYLLTSMSCTVEAPAGSAPSELLDPLLCGQHCTCGRHSNISVPRPPPPTPAVEQRLLPSASLHPLASGVNPTPYIPCLPGADETLNGGLMKSQGLSCGFFDRARLPRAGLPPLSAVVCRKR